jgi:type I restriction enzyme M protein
VFGPYAGVSTAILLFTRGGTTEDVFFYKLENDGFSLDDKRARIEDEDMSDCLKRWEEWQKKGSKMVTARTDKAFLVPKAELVENEYDLSINRYQEVDYEESKTDKPKDILKSLAGIENTIAKDLKDLEKLLG